MPIEPTASIEVFDATTGTTTGVTRSVQRWHGSINVSQLDAAVTASNIQLDRDEANNMYKLGNAIYLDSDCRLDFSNVSFDLQDYSFYIHPDAQDHIIWRDCLLFSSKRRVKTTTRYITFFARGGYYNAIGGGVLGAQRGSVNTNTEFEGIHLTLGDVKDVQIRQDDVGSYDMKFFRISKSGTYDRVKILRIDRLNTDGNIDSRDVRLIMQNCEFRSTRQRGTQVGPLNNASMIVNNCTFGNRVDTTPVEGSEDIDKFMFDQVSGGVLAIPHYIYFCGTSADRWSPNWQAQSSGLLISHKGGVRYYQGYKDGEVFGGFRVRLHSTIAGTRNTRRSEIDTSLARMIKIPTDDVGADGKFDVMTVDRFRQKTTGTGSWNTHVESDHELTVRERGVVFQEVDINDPTLSLGRGDNPVPFVFQTDENFDEAARDLTIQSVEGIVALDFTTRSMVIQPNTTFTVGLLYSYLKILMTDWNNMIRPMDWSFDGDVLDLDDWNIAINNGCVINDDNGRRIVTTGDAVLGNNIVNNGVEIIDHEGVTVNIQSTAEDSRAFVSWTVGNVTTRVVRDLPATLQIPLFTIASVTVNAPGYIHQRYTVNTGLQTLLDARLPLDPSIDLNVSFTDDEYAKFSVRSEHTSSWMTYDGSDRAGKCEVLVGEINLYAQLAKTKRIIDRLFNEDDGLYWLHHYVDELSGSPLSGSPIIFGSDRIRADTTKLDFIKTSLASTRTRLGVPLWTPGDMAYFAPLIANKGNVVFDGLQTVADVNEETLIATIESLSGNELFKSNIGSGVWNYSSSGELRSHSFGKLFKGHLNVPITSQGHIGRFRIFANTEIAGGGSGNKFLEGQGTNVHPGQFFVVRKTPVQNGPYFQTRVDLYDLTGEPDGTQYLGGEFIDGGVTQIYNVVSATFDEDYMYMITTGPGSTGRRLHRIPLDTTDTSLSYESVAIGFNAVGMTVNGDDLVLARYRNDDDLRIDLLTRDKDISTSDTYVKIGQVDPNNHRVDDIGLAVTGRGVDKTITVVTGTVIARFDTEDYGIVSEKLLEFEAHSVLWWHDTAWTINKVSSTEWWMTPMGLDNEPVHTYNMLQYIRDNRPELIWGYTDTLSNHKDDSIGKALVDFVTKWMLMREQLTDTRIEELDNVGSSTSISDSVVDEIAQHVWDEVSSGERITSGTFGGDVNAIMNAINELINNRLTDTRAGYLDNLTSLDANVSSRLASTDYYDDRMAIGDLQGNWREYRRVMTDELIRKLDNRSVISLGYIPFADDTFASGYIKESDGDGEILSVIRKALDTGVIKGSRFLIEDGEMKSVGDYITLSNKEIVSAANDETYNYFLTRDLTTSDYRMRVHTRGTTTHVELPTITGSRAVHVSSVVGLMEVARLATQIHIEWTYQSPTYDHYIDVTDASERIAIESYGKFFYILHGNVLYVRRLRDDGTEMDEIGSHALVADNLMFIHGVLWAYDNGKWYPLDDSYKKIDVEWAVIHRNDIESKVDEIKEKTGKLVFSGVGSVSNPYRLENVNFANVIEQIDRVVEQVTQMTWDADGDPNTDDVNTLLGDLRDIQSKVTTIPISVLNQISEAIRDNADYDDDGNTTTSLKETLKIIISDIDTIEKQLLTDSVQSIDTVFKRIKDSKAILDKLNISGDGTEGDPYILNAHASNVTGTVDLSSVTNQLNEVIEQLTENTWNNDDDDGTTPEVNTVLGILTDVQSRVGSLPTTDTVADLSGVSSELTKVVEQLTQLSFDDDGDPTTENVATVLKKIENIISAINDLPTTDNVADLSTLSADVAKIKEQVLENTFNHDDDTDTDEIKTLLGKINEVRDKAEKIKISGAGTTQDPYLVNVIQHTLREISEAVRDDATYEDGSGASIDLGNAIADITSAVLSIGNQLTTEPNIGDTVLERIIRIEDKTNKIPISGTGTDDDPYLVDVVKHSLADISAGVRDIAMYADGNGIDTTFGEVVADITRELLGLANDLMVEDTTAAESTFEKIRDMKDVIDKIQFTGDGSESDPYLVNVVQHSLTEIAVGVRDLATYVNGQGNNVTFGGAIDEITREIGHIGLEIITEDDNDPDTETLLERILTIEGKVKKLNFNSGNDVKATLDGELVTTDSASREMSKATGFATPTDVTTAETNVKTAITNAHTTTDGKIDVVDEIVDRVVERTDKIEFESEIEDENKPPGRERLHTYTDVEVDSDGMEIDVNLDVVEQGIEDLKEKLDVKVSSRLAANKYIEPSLFVDKVRANVIEVNGKPVKSIDEFRNKVQKMPEIPSAKEIREEIEREKGLLDRIRTVTSKIEFDGGNKVKATVKGEKVKIDEESVKNVRPIGYATSSDVRKVKDEVMDRVKKRADEIVKKVNDVQLEVERVKLGNGKIKDVEKIVEELREKMEKTKPVDVEDIRRNVSEMMKQMKEDEKENIKDGQIEVKGKYYVMKDKDGNEIGRFEI